MGGVCMYISCTWKPVWPVFVILVTLSCMLHCSESQPAAGDGKMYPRGNHWAVGHLMGKKSTDSLAELQEANSDYLTPSEADGVTEPERYERLMEALKQQKNRRQMVAERLLGLGSGWREENRDKYLREMSNLLLALRLEDEDST